MKKFRDRLGWAIACLGLYIATPWYRDKVSAYVKFGMQESLRDVDAKHRWKTLEAYWNHQITAQECARRLAMKAG